MNKGWKFLNKLWCWVGEGNKVIWLYQLRWKCKLVTFNSLLWPIYIFHLVDITKLQSLGKAGLINLGHVKKTKSTNVGDVRALIRVQMNVT